MVLHAIAATHGKKPHDASGHFRCLRQDATWCFAPLLMLTARSRAALWAIAVAHGRRSCSILPRAVETAQRATQHPATSSGNSSNTMRLLATSSRNSPKSHAVSYCKQRKWPEVPCGFLPRAAETAQRDMQCPAASSANGLKCHAASCHEQPKWPKEPHSILPRAAETAQSATRLLAASSGNGPKSHIMSYHEQRKWP